MVHQVAALLHFYFFKGCSFFSLNFRIQIYSDGEPIILISNGKLLDYNLKKVKITINKVMMQLREKDIFNVDDVALATIESDGELTVLPKVNKQPITTGDLNISTNYNGLLNDIRHVKENNKSIYIGNTSLALEIEFELFFSLIMLN